LFQIDSNLSQKLYYLKTHLLHSSTKNDLSRAQKWG